MTPLLRRLGRTDLLVSSIGLGAGPLGDLSLGDAAATRVIHAALDAGVNVIDTAPSYGCSEDRVGRALEGRRERVVLVTKGGYGVPGVPDWTADVIERGVEQALGRLRTDHVDVFLLHSCDRELLARGDLVEALGRVKSAGKTRAIGYSGDGPALAWAAASGAFDVLECSVNLVDQESLSVLAHHGGGGVLAKRAMANAAWRAAPDPARTDVAVYRQRLDTLFGDAMREGDLEGSTWDEVAIRFSAHAGGVACALVGTQRAEHIVRAVELAARGPLPQGHLRTIARRHHAHGRDWPAVV
jgi:aryl-alcohol dehydrogenase-like predicted oxidoreductase